MGKSSAMWGKTSGKVGGLVYATSGGEQIVREYNPNVANPSTDAQVKQRAKMKLMSQLSACLAPTLAMQKDGLVSVRNKFTKRNFNYAYASDGTAQVSYENLQLTEGSLALPQIIAELMPDAESGVNSLSVRLATKQSANISRVVYSVFIKTHEGKLEFQLSKIANGSDDLSNINTIFDDQDYSDKEIVIYAYGMIDTSERASARYGNLNVVNGEDIAKLVSSRSISFTDYQFTQTRGATLGSNGDPITPTPAGSFRVFVTANGNGTVTGAGTYQQGQQVTVTATPAQGYEFVSWKLNGSNTIVSHVASYIFQIERQMDLVATFQRTSNDSL